MSEKKESLASILKLQNIIFSYAKNVPKPILNDINLSITKNKVVAIAGPNGAGKTTLLKILIGLLHPFEGKIFLYGKEISDNSDLIKKIGMVFQNPDEQVFFPRIEEDIAFGLRNQGVPEKDIREKIHEVLHRLKITYLEGRSFFNLSFGEKKKVSIAGILVTKPEIIILDEPTIGLDPWSKEEFYDILNNLAVDTSLIMATHDSGLLKRVDKIYFLWNGSFIAEFDDFSSYNEFSKSFNPNRE